MNLVLHDPTAERIELPEHLTAGWVMAHCPPLPEGTRVLFTSASGAPPADPAGLTALARRLDGLHVGFANCGTLGIDLITRSAQLRNEGAA